jgi:uncharacterized phage infection (PIP) family protein YhgE
VPDKPKPGDAPATGADIPKIGPGIIFPIGIDITEVLKVLDNSTNLTSIDQYKQLQPALQKAVPDLKSYLTRQDAQNSSLQNQLTNAQTQITTLQNANNDLTNQVAALNAQIAQLKAQLASQPQKALPLHVAQSFKDAMDKIQSDARAAAGPQTTITNMQIAVKALVSVQDGAVANTKDAVLVFPDPSTPPDPNLLSTLTVNFGAIPNLKAAKTVPGSTSVPSGGPTPSPPPVAAPRGSGTQPVPPTSKPVGKPEDRAAVSAKPAPAAPAKKSKSAPGKPSRGKT